MPLASHLLGQALLLLLTQGSDIAPVSGIAGNLDLSLASLVDPEEIHLIEISHSTQIYIEPLGILCQFRLPYTGEVHGWTP